MKLKDIIELPYCERGTRLTQGGDLYFNIGQIKVISSSTTGPMGYYNKHNYELKENSFVYAIEGANAGYVSIYPPQKIWLMDVAGVVNIKKEFVKKYGKEQMALFLQYYFVKNRHNNGTQPKFNLKRCLEIEINFDIIKRIAQAQLTVLEQNEETFDRIIENYGSLQDRCKNYISLREFMVNYKDRGKRLVVGRDLYQNLGDIKVISSTTTGPMGYYNQSNYELKENDFVYAIDGANAGYVSIYPPQMVWLTDHAGVISVKDIYANKYSKLTIAIFLQNIFTQNLSNTGTQPMFILKSMLDVPIDISYLDVLEGLLVEQCEES